MNYTRSFKYCMPEVVLGIVILSCLILSGCAPELGPFFEKVDNIPPNTGLIYFYRPLRPIGYGSWYDVKSSSETVAVLPSGAYYPYFAKTGKTEFNVWLGKPVSLDVQAGNTYYIRMLVKRGTVSVEPILELVPSAIGEEEIEDCKLTPILHPAETQSNTGINGLQ